MTKRKLRASAFVVTTTANARLDREGTVVSRRRDVVYGDEVERTVKDIVESTRLEGVDLGIDFAATLFHDVAGRPLNMRPKRVG